MHVPISLRWSDFDAYGHVNNAEMFRLLEEARGAVFWGSDDQAERPATAALEGGPSATVLSLIARQEIEYLAPIPYLRTPIDAEVWVSRFGAVDIDISYELYSPVGFAPRVLYTRALSTLVTVDGATNRPLRLTAEQREAWSGITDAPVTFKRR